MKHTQGPWYVFEGPPNGIAVHWSPDGQICPLRWTDGLRPDVTARVKADANLIAAAPTMYVELELAADTFRDFSVVLRAIGKDVMSAAADVAERHIREQLAAIQNGAESEHGS